MTAPPKLTLSEEKLVQDAAEGKAAEYTPQGQPPDDPANGESWGEDRTIRAEIIRDLLMGTNREWGVARVVWIKGAKIVGALDLMRVKTKCALMLEGCYVQAEVNLCFAEVPDLWLTGCRAVCLVAQQLKTGFLSLNGTIFSSIIDLRSARISGNLSCEGTQCCGAGEIPAFNAQQVRVQSSMLLKGLRAVGPVRKRGVVDLSGAIIDGQLSCDSAGVSNTDGVALVAESITVGRSVILTNGRFCGGVTLASSKVGGAVFCTGSRFVAGRTGEAFVGDGIQVGASVQLGPPIGGNAPSGATTCYVGLVRLPRAKVGDHLDCDRACFMVAAKSPAATSGGDGPLEVLVADGIEVRGAVRFREASVFGAVAISSSRIGGDLDCSRARFYGSSGLVAERATISGLFLWAGVTLNPETMLDLLDARVGVLADDMQSWPSPGQLRIDGLIYRRVASDTAFDSPNDPGSRLEWLKLQPKFLPGPYQQFAQWLRSEGRENDAKEVLIGKEDERRRSRELSCREYLWLSLLKVTIAYGYKPGRAVWVSLGVIFLWSLIIWAGAANGIMSPTGRGSLASPQLSGEERAYEALSPLWYSADVFLPIHAFRQEESWWPTAEKWRWCWCLPRLHTLPWGWVLRLLLWVEVLLGWTLTAFLIAGITGVVRSE